MTSAAPTRGAIAGLVALSLFLLCFLVWPLVESFRGAFFDPGGHLTFTYVRLLFGDPVYVEGLVNALGVATAATAAALGIGVGVALVLDRFEFPGRKVLGALIPLPLIMPPFVGAIGMKQLFGRMGALNALLVGSGVRSGDHPIDWLAQDRFVVVVALTALHLYPVVYFNVSAALSNLGAETEEAALCLGCSPRRTLLRVTLPLIGPGLFASASVVYIWALTELGVPLMCDYATITSVQIWSGLRELGQNPLVHVLVVLVLLSTVAIYAVARFAFGRSTSRGAPGRISFRAPKRLDGARGLACTAFVAAVVSIAALPGVGVALVSVAGDWYATVLPSRFTLDHFRSALAHDLVVPSIANSLRYVALSTCLDLAIGVSIAYLAVRGQSAIGKVLDVASMLPLAIPGLVLAFGYLALSHEGRPLAWLNPVKDPTALLVVAYAIRRLPFVVRAASAGFEQLGSTLEEAARNLGASTFGVLRRVSLPLLAPHLLAGAVLAFALSMLEVSDSLILAQRQATFPITKAVFELFQVLGDGRETAAALGVWGMVFLALALAVARSFLGKRWSGVFRV